MLKEIRKVRVGPWALFDFGGTIVLAWALARRMSWQPAPTIAAALVAGEVVHKVVGVETPGLAAPFTLDKR